jgi:glycosyltransferase involved in cell wall biosynthesis
MEPTVSIVIPTYNRSRFAPLVELNICIQTYRKICEVLIADDGDERLEFVCPYPVKYLKLDQRLTIGQKRNVLAHYASGEFIAHMDDDDIYFASYISHSIGLLTSTGKHCTGSHAMLMTDISWSEAALLGGNPEMANEATLVYRKSFWTERGFSQNQTSEALAFLSGRAGAMVMSDIREVMVCFCHKGNTVDKTVWLQNKAHGFPNYFYHRLILTRIFSNPIPCPTSSEKSA